MPFVFRGLKRFWIKIFWAGHDFDLDQVREYEIKSDDQLELKNNKNVSWLNGDLMRRIA